MERYQSDRNPSEQGEEHLLEIARDLETRYPVRALPARINGSRWAFFGKIDLQEFPVAASMRFRCADQYGLIIYGWDTLSTQEQNEITRRLGSG